MCSETEFFYLFYYPLIKKNSSSYNYKREIRIVVSLSENIKLSALIEMICGVLVRPRSYNLSMVETVEGLNFLSR